MRYIGIIILLVLCLTLLLLTGCKINTVKPEIASVNLENQEDINQSSNNSQSSSTEPAEEPAEESVTVYPQKWATGDGTAENPWANNCIRSAYDNVPEGGTIFLRAGYYQLADEFDIEKQINMVGEGINKTIILTVDAYGIVIVADYVSLKGFTIDGDAQTDGEGWLSCISVNSCNYALLEDIEAKNAGIFGISPYEVNHCTFQNIYVHDNYEHGIHPGSDTTGRNKYNIYRDIYAWNNGNEGFSDRGNDKLNPDEACYNVYDNIQCWGNGGYGILIGGQKEGVLSNSFASGNGKSGILLYHLEDFNIHDCSTTLNSLEGLHIDWSSKNINFTNVVIKNNNVSDTDGIGGIKLDNSSGIRFTSCQSYDDRDTPLQAYGIQLEGTNTGISILNCKLTPNKYGGIYNPTGVVITVITEKGGFLLLSL